MFSLNSHSRINNQCVLNVVVNCVVFLMSSVIEAWKIFNLRVNSYCSFLVFSLWSDKLPCQRWILGWPLWSPNDPVPPQAGALRRSTSSSVLSSHKCRFSLLLSEFIRSHDYITAIWGCWMIALGIFFWQKNLISSIWFVSSLRCHCFPHL